MAQVDIFTVWPYGWERFSIDLDSLPDNGSVVEVQGYWPDENKSASYKADFSHQTFSDGKRELRLEYRPDLLADLDPDLESYIGTLILNIEPGLRKATAKWETTLGQVSQPEGSITCHVLEGNITRNIELEAYTRIKRQQQELKSALIDIDQCCVLSGETTVAVLEAAHIVGVAHSGDDQISNGVLLRADLHRLFDRGLFYFDNAGYVMITGGSISTEYRHFLEGRAMSAGTFSRVSGRIRQSNLNRAALES